MMQKLKSFALEKITLRKLCLLHREYFNLELRKKYDGDNSNALK